MLSSQIGARGHLKWPATGKQDRFKPQLPWAEASEVSLAALDSQVRPCGPQLSRAGHPSAGAGAAPLTVVQLLGCVLLTP